MEYTERDPEFLKASEILLPMLKAIPKDAIRRHSLLFDDIILETIRQRDLYKLELHVVLAKDIPYYLSYGKSKSQYEALIEGFANR